MKIEGKTFIITGGASGLGESTVRRFVKAKANVVIADVNEENGNVLVKELGKSTIFVSTDISSEESVKKLVQTTLDTFGAVHGAVNCAGIAKGSLIISNNGPHSLELFRKVIDVNLVGNFNVIRLVADAMQKLKPIDESGERGVFINTASVAAYDGIQGISAYSASKAGVVGMTLPIAREFAPLGIRVMTIAPGWFDTPMTQGKPLRASIAQTIPFPSRLGVGPEFAELCIHIVENSYLNGETIRLDGAYRASYAKL